MSDIKFACPSCGQKIKCDSGHAGLKIGCPGCGGELLIPRVEEVSPEVVKPAMPVERPVQKPAEVREEDPTVVLRKPESTGAVVEKKAEPVMRKPEPKPVSRPAPKEDEEEPVDLSCICPVCRSHLKVKQPSKKKAVMASGMLPMAELVRPGSSEARFAMSAAATAGEVASKPAVTPEAKPAESAVAGAESKPAPAVFGNKPRISYLLTGKPPAPLPRPDGSPRKRPQGGGSGGEADAP
jgi:hypothetical protein